MTGPGNSAWQVLNKSPVTFLRPSPAWRMMSPPQSFTVPRRCRVSMRVGLSGIMSQEFVKHLGNQLRRKWDGGVTKGQTPRKPAYGHRLVLGKTLEREIDPQTAPTVVRIFTE